MSGLSGLTGKIESTVLEYMGKYAKMTGVALVAIAAIGVLALLPELTSSLSLGGGLSSNISMAIQLGIPGLLVIGVRYLLIKYYGRGEEANCPSHIKTYIKALNLLACVFIGGAGLSMIGSLVSIQPLLPGISITILGAVITTGGTGIALLLGVKNKTALGILGLLGSIALGADAGWFASVAFSLNNPNGILGGVAICLAFAPACSFLKKALHLLGED